MSETVQRDEESVVDDALVEVTNLKTYYGEGTALR